MAPIFKNIRQNSISNNRFTRYLLYAIGEIILVVIGILIALQVNNWNEERKLDKQRKGYTESIINDFEKDSINLQNFIFQLKRDSTTFKSFENRLKSQPVNYDTIEKMFRYEFPAYVRPDYSFNNNTLVSVIEDHRNQYPKGLVDSLVILVKIQKDFEGLNKVFIDKYFDILNRKNTYPFANYFFDGGSAIKDSIWARTDPREMLADFQQLSDWKLANTQLVLRYAKGIQEYSLIMKNRLKELEKDD